MSRLVKVGVGPEASHAETIKMGGPLSTVLPEGGFPLGAVVELVSPANLGHGLGVALAACAESQRQSAEHGGEMAWCAFLDPDRTLFGPAVEASGVRLERLLVLHPPRSLLAATAVRVASSQLFSVIVVDVASVPGVRTSPAAARAESMQAWWKAARRLALAVENTNTTLFLLTKAEAHRASSLPVAMRVEMENRGFDGLAVGVAKEKHGRVTQPRRIAWTRPGQLRGDAVEAFTVSHLREVTGDRP
jgi:cell division inhibitor SulA/protein ImuA